ncbi:hypothetical protein [Halolactibacillus sp. JCM 19043]|uniref:hypothetical protein n=1 Tax=Halolactibacillus sp. JCM 19043 TaxID=1460638 RepID=UPI000782B027|nr:hypothetical protein [Halolactibacillus sp. JCM 19043]
MSVALQDFFTQLHSQRENTQEHITFTYKKLLKDRPSSSTQAAFLTQLTKKDLDEIRRFSGIEGVSKLTKQPLIKRLVQEQSTAIDRFILTMDNERLNWLKKILAGDKIYLDSFTAISLRSLPILVLLLR